MKSIQLNICWILAKPRESKIVAQKTLISTNVEDGQKMSDRVAYT